MKELSVEEKAKAYDEALKFATIYHKQGDEDMKTMMETCFPELKESEDERIRKALIRFHKSTIDIDGIKGEQIVAWLEKQGEQKPADKVKPKFKVGNWVIFNEAHDSVYQVERIDNYRYYLRHYLGGTLSVPCNSELIRPWTIKDAKDGDVLAASDDSIFLFKGTIDGACKHYVALTTDGAFKFNEGLEHYWETSTAAHPATKEQRDLLFKKMKEAGYEWDDKKKELKKIEQKPVEWSEEEKGNVDIIVSRLEADIEYWKSRSKRRIDEDKRVIDWLKSLRPQNTWKPSNQQIKVCKEVYADILSAKGFDLGTVNSELNRLEEQLKKLMEE